MFHDKRDSSPGNMDYYYDNVNIMSYTDAADIWVSSHVSQQIFPDIDQSNHLWAQPLQRYVATEERPLFTACPPSFQQQNCNPMPQSSAMTTMFPYAINYRMMSPAPSQDFSSSMSSTAHSPDFDFDDKYPPSTFYSPMSPAEPLFADFPPYHDAFPTGSGTQGQALPSTNHVALSELHAQPEPLSLHLTDFAVTTNQTFLDPRQTYQEYSDNNEPIDGPQFPAESTTSYHHSDVDAEGEPEDEETIEAIPARTSSPFSPPPSEHSDEDETYTPPSIRTRKRRGSSIEHGSPIKRARKAKTTKLRSKPESPSVGKGLACEFCDRNDLKDAETLANHVRLTHIRAYPCVFDFAGCTSTFASKNEWKRHVSTQHLCFDVWICDLGGCGKPSHTQRGSRGTLGSEFNRKDLFTQHLKRMHAPPESKSLEWAREVKDLQESCKRAKRYPPTLLGCCVQGCEAKFRGELTWNERMEHTGKHLEEAAKRESDGRDRLVVDQRRDDMLIKWALQQNVIVKRGAGYGLSRD